MVVDTGLVMLVQWPRYGFTGFFYGLLSSNSASRYNGDRDDSDNDLRFDDDHDGIVKMMMMLSVVMMLSIVMMLSMVSKGKGKGWITWGSSCYCAISGIILTAGIFFAKDPKSF